MLPMATSVRRMRCGWRSTQACGQAGRHKNQRLPDGGWSVLCPQRANNTGGVLQHRAHDQVHCPARRGRHLRDLLCTLRSRAGGSGRRRHHGQYGPARRLDRGIRPGASLLGIPRRGPPRSPASTFFVGDLHTPKRLQSTSGEELSVRMPDIFDKAF